MWTHQSRVNLLICIHQGPWLQSQREVFESLKVNMAMTEVFREKEALLHNVLQKGTGVVIQIRHGPGMIGSLVEKAFPVFLIYVICVFFMLSLTDWRRVRPLLRQMTAGFA